MTKQEKDANPLIKASPSVWAVIPAGGTGQRYSKHANKLLLPLLSKPVLWWSVKAFLETPCIEGVIIAAHSDYQQDYQEVLSELIQVQSKPVFWTLGGKNRRDSVYSALQALQDHLPIYQKMDSNQILVSVHDAARPLITPQDIEKSLQPLLSSQSPQLAGTVLGKALMDTIKRLKTKSTLSAEAQEISETINRNEHWAAQTPQNFCLPILLKAHLSVSREIEMTDDSQLVEIAQLGRMLAVEADFENLKLTRAEDFAYCEWVLKQRQLASKVVSK